MDRKTRELIKIRQEMQRNSGRQVNNPNMGNGCIKVILIFGLLLLILIAVVLAILIF